MSVSQRLNGGIEDLEKFERVSSMLGERRVEQGRPITLRPECSLPLITSTSISLLVLRPRADQGNEQLGHIAGLARTYFGQWSQRPLEYER